MDRNSRTKNSIYNFITSIGAQLITIIMSFICRTVFINTLGKSYLGIGSLFSNILSMLSLTDLGVGTAILFKMYQPLAENDQQRIQILMKFYKQVYRIIAIVIAVLGVCLIPFLPALISDYDKLEALGLNAVLIFILYLLQSVTSYLFFAYKSAIIKADQKEYILTTVSFFIIIGQNLLQMLVLILCESFIAYVSIGIFSIIIGNIVNALIVKRRYPYLSEKVNGNLSTDEKKGIFKDCGALMLYRVNGVVLKSTDNIVLSAFLGLDMVAMYSNYYIFYTTINTLFTKIYNAFVYSIGNLHANKNTEHEYTVFEASVFIAMILGGTAAVGIFVVADEFVYIWIGDTWVLPQPFSLLMALELFTLSLRSLLTKYRNAYGLFQQAKYRPVWGAIINIVVSVILVRYWGICGVLVGTIVADWTTFMAFDPRILHKYGFGNRFPVSHFYKQIFLNLSVIAVFGAVLKMVCSNVYANLGWFSVGIHICICGLAVPLGLFCVNWGNEGTQYIAMIVKRKLGKGAL